MEKNNILAALKVQPLSEEEKASRHILGRLFGPIATSKRATRNGRYYNEELWQKALNDEVFLEKVKNKSIFLELGHPIDREQTIIDKTCAIIPELPKIIDGDLYAYVDIVDLPAGRVLKTLVDYGFVPGISSRGSGDVSDDNEVDPETFFLETWDIVQLPAVKEARLSVCESFNPKKKNEMKKALAESYKEASAEDKKVMEEALNNLNIKLEDVNSVLPGGTPRNIEDIPTCDDEDKILNEEEDIEDIEETEIDSVEDDSDDESVEDSEVDVEEESLDVNTVGEFIKELKSFDADSELIINPVNIDGVEYRVDFTFDDSEEGKVSIGVDCIPTEENNEDKEDIEKDVEEVASEEEIDVDDSEDQESAEDNGDDEMMESFKEMIRQKGLLENELKALRGKNAVGDAKVKELKEEVNRYKSAFERVSKVAAATKTAEKQVKTLTEQLTQKSDLIRKLKSEKARALTESTSQVSVKIRALTEEVNQTKQALNKVEQQKTEQATLYKQKIKERTDIAKQYRDKFTQAVEQYTQFRASMLGVKVAEIKNKLDENYSIADVDKVCDKILTESVNMSNLPFNIPNTGLNRAYMKQNNASIDPDLKDLMELAGLD